MYLLFSAVSSYIFISLLIKTFLNIVFKQSIIHTNIILVVIINYRMKNKIINIIYGFIEVCVKYDRTRCDSTTTVIDIENPMFLTF